VAALQDIILNAKKAGVNKLIGMYIPSPRNIVVKDHYQKLGFFKMSGGEEVENWMLDINNYEPPKILITIDK